jgi:hypothetical protein
LLPQILAVGAVGRLPPLPDGEVAVPEPDALGLALAIEVEVEVEVGSAVPLEAVTSGWFTGGGVGAAATASALSTSLPLLLITTPAVLATKAGSAKAVIRVRRLGMETFRGPGRNAVLRTDSAS